MNPEIEISVGEIKLIGSSIWKRCGLGYLGMPNSDTFAILQPNLMNFGTNVFYSKKTKKIVYKYLKRTWSFDVISVNPEKLVVKLSE
jgi:hypothetical protein